LDEFEEFKLLLRVKIDIVEYIGRHIKLKRDGTKYVAKCPFHQDMETNLFHFVVNPNNQNFRCTWCGIGGDIIGFVMHHNKIEYKDALAALSEETGISLPEYRPRAKVGKIRIPYDELKAAGLEVRLDKDYAGAHPHDFLQQKRSGDYAQLLNHAIACFFFRKELLYDELKIPNDRPPNKTESTRILDELLPFIARTPSVCTNSYQIDMLGNLLRLGAKGIETALAEFKKPMQRGRNFFYTNPYPTTPYELRIASMMIKEPHIIEYFRGNIRQEWFKDAGCKAVFLFLCENTKFQEFDFSYQQPGDDLPLLEGAYRRNIPREIVRHAHSQSIKISEEEMTRLYNFLKQMPMRFTADELRLLLEEAHLENRLTEFEKCYPVSELESRPDLVMEYFDLFDQYKQIHSRFAAKLYKDYDKLVYRRKQREEREKEKLKGAQTEFDFGANKDPEKEDDDDKQNGNGKNGPTGLLFDQQ
jgi:DNA primase